MQSDSQGGKPVEASVSGGTRRSATQPRAQATINKILDGAAATLIERSYAGTTTDAIAETTGVSVGTLYRYFDGKDDVLTALFQHRAHALSERLASVPGPAEAETATLADLIMTAADNTELGPELYRELRRVPGIAGQLDALREASMDRVVEFIEATDIAPSHVPSRELARLIVLCAEGLGQGATEADISAGIMARFADMVAAYLEPR